MTRIAGLVVLAAIVLAGFARPGRGEGHGIVIDSTPKHQETVTAPKRLVIRFNSRLEKHLCSVTITGPQPGTALQLRQTADGPPDTLIYRLEALAPGPYQARWKVLAADGHVTEGIIRFTVSGPAAAR